MRTLTAPGARAAVAAATTALAAIGLLAACGGGNTVVISGSDGAAVSINPSGGQISVSSSDGSIVVGKDELPSGWPSEVGKPDGFEVKGSATTTVGGKPGYTANLEAEGDQLATVNAWLGSLESAGFTKKAGIGGGTTSGGITSLVSSTWDVTAISMVSDGKTGLIVNVKAAGA